MAYKFKNREERRQVYRDSLRPDWQALLYEDTDKGKNLPKPSTVKQYQDAEVFELDRDIENVSQKTLFEVVHSRRSTRQYKDIELTYKELSYLLNLTCFIKKFGPGYAIGVIPTGGATNSLETYVYLRQVEGMKCGIYHYMKDTNQLQLIRDDVTDDTVDQATAGQLRGAQAVFFWTTTPYRTEYKYDYTAHKMIAQEAGHACQNLYLACESIGYGAVAIAAYNQTWADKLLEVGGDEFVVYVATIGKKIDE